METLTETTKPASALLGTASRIVVKIGSALLVDPQSGLNTGWLAGLAQDLARFHARGQGIVVVSSGAIALGRQVLGLPPGDLSLEDSQAAAAVGQTRLARAWEEAMSPHGITTAQVLLTLEDTQKRRRYLNGRATLAALLNFRTIPVVNENDTVATDEIRYGDNDRLAARVALMVDADAAILLSDVDGLYTDDPRRGGEAVHLAEIDHITPEIEAMAGDAGTAGARGGMRTKVLAAKTATQGGCAMAVARGDVVRPLSALEEGARATWFRAAMQPNVARKKWIAGMKPLGHLVIDSGAEAALRRGKSLLSAGVRGVVGDFQRADPIAIVHEDGRAVGAGLVGYGADDARAIAGAQSDAIAEILGYPGRASMVHADDIVTWDV